MMIETTITARVAVAACCVVSLIVYLVSDNPRVKEVARLLFLASATALFIRA